MTIKEAAIIEVYTGICFLTGDKRKYAYEYASSLIGRPVYTHEFLTLKEELKKRSYKDFIEICKNLEETHMERLTRPTIGWTVGVTREKLADKLRPYENIGLTSEEVQQLKERDTAKAPIDIDDEFDMYVCASCNMVIETIGDKKQHHFCLNCGQRLKFGE